MIVTRRIFNATPDLTQLPVSGPFRASDGQYDIYAGHFLHSRYAVREDAEAAASLLKDGS